MSPLQIAKRYLSLKTHRIFTLPIAILEPHGACNCRCVMCDIWKGNDKASSMDMATLDGLLESFRRLGTRWVVMTGGEAMMHPHFFDFCAKLKQVGLKITVLSTGLLLKAKADQIIRHTDEVIVSLDGSPAVHNQIRRVPRAFEKLAEGVSAVRMLNPKFAISARSVIQKANFRDWRDLIESARSMGLDRVSFLPADVTSEAFNRANAWDLPRQNEVKPGVDELEELRDMVEQIIVDHGQDIDSGFIAEGREKLRNIYRYYAAFYKQNPFPTVRCNAPWVSAYVQSDGVVRPCFFLPDMGSLKKKSLHELINQKTSISQRANLDPSRHPTCGKCVCTLYLHPRTQM